MPEDHEEPPLPGFDADRMFPIDHGEGRSAQGHEPTHAPEVGNEPPQSQNPKPPGAGSDFGGIGRHPRKILRGSKARNPSFVTRRSGKGGLRNPTPDHRAYRSCIAGISASESRLSSLDSRMSPPLIVSAGHWLGFAAFVLGALALDLGLFHRESREVRVREALFWTLTWAICALIFATAVAPRTVPGWDTATSALFLTGYLVELCLSMDNVFVIAVIFSYFGVPRPWQHRVLFWGILGALVLRGTMIWLGAELIERVHWMMYVFGGFLLFTGVKMLRAPEEEAPPDLSRNPVVRWVRHCLPVSEDLDRERFTTRSQGRWMITPLTVVLLVVETTDVVFAVDSIPAIFGITREPFLVFTSNIFAILGLRSLYFVLASAMGQFRHLKTGLALVLVFIGAKMLAEELLLQWLGDRLRYVSLAVVVGLIGLSILASVFSNHRGPDSGKGSGP